MELTMMLSGVPRNNSTEAFLWTGKLKGNGDPHAGPTACSITLGERILVYPRASWRALSSECLEDRRQGEEGLGERGEGGRSFVKATKRLCGVIKGHQVQNKDQKVEEEVEKW